MGCISSKQSAALPAHELPSPHAFPLPENGMAILRSSSKAKKSSGWYWDFDHNVSVEKNHESFNNELKKSMKKNAAAPAGGGDVNVVGHAHGHGHEHGHGHGVKLSYSNRFVQAEQVAAGWPSWLSSAAPEAIHGWVPLKADAFEKLEKIGQGTYSSVFRARELETGRIVALKKVRFDNFQAESIRFMAREIMILRRLDHPNIMKLEGLITSRLSCSIYFVFEYMEHDLAGLVSCPEIKFSDAQVKCYMKQLLSGIEHCHLRGIMHRDIKTSNILVNNKGILKLADFGLANIFDSRRRQVLTSRVVTLWYRPPELLMGSTNYGVSIDLWSVGCVFAELLIGKPILKGRTEVEQLHKIFKLCGSPPDEFWKKYKLPHATMFKPQQTYPSTLREKCKDFPPSAVHLMEAFLSVDPQKRGTASSALMSDYFTTKPYACDPSSLPKYPPNKEIDAKNREESRRKKADIRVPETGSRKTRRVRKTLQEANGHFKLPTKEEVQNNAHRNDVPKTGAKVRGVYKHAFKPPQDTVSDISQVTNYSLGDNGMQGNGQVATSSGFAWVKRPKNDVKIARSRSKSSSTSQLSALDSASLVFGNYISPSTQRETAENRQKICNNPTDINKHETATHVPGNQHNQFNWSYNFDATDEYHSQELTAQHHLIENPVHIRNKLDEGACIEFSGPLLMESREIDKYLQRNESNIRNAARRSRLRDK